jgi:hypothetical protein
MAKLESFVELTEASCFGNVAIVPVTALEGLYV